MYALIISATIVLLYLIARYTQSSIDRQLHAIKMEHERRKQVLLLRWHILNTMGHKAWENLPDFESMVNSKKPLEVKEWVEVDKLVNLN